RHRRERTQAAPWASRGARYGNSNRNPGPRRTRTRQPKPVPGFSGKASNTREANNEATIQTEAAGAQERSRGQREREWEQRQAHPPHGGKSQNSRRQRIQRTHGPLLPQSASGGQCG